MCMNYIIYGDDISLIQDKLNELISENKDALILRFDDELNDTDINEVIDSCRNISLFNSKILVLYKDPIVLSKKIDENEVKPLIDYCKKPEFDTNLVFYTYENSFNTRLSCFKEISSNAQVIKYNRLSKKDFYSFARNIINSSNLHINDDAANYLINAVNLDSSLLKQNIEVLLLYPEPIDLNVVKKLITYSSDEDVFNLINSLTSKDVESSIIYARRLLKNDESILRLLSTLSSQLRFLYAVNYYYENGKRNDEIMDILNITHSYRLQKALESLRFLKGKDIMNLLSKLSDLDLSLKINDEFDESLKLELFIISLI